MSVRAAFLSLTIAVMFGSPACAGSLSGTYVSLNPTIASMVQIVETGDQRITGRYEEFVLQPAGKTVDMNASLTGAVDGQTVVVTLKTSEPFASPIILSGTIQGNLLHLSGGTNGVNLFYNLVRADEAAFRSGVASITGQANKIIQAKQQADQLSNMKNLTDKLAKFQAAAENQSPKFPGVESKYRQMTALMRKALEREKSIRGGGQASVARNQISVWINQAAIQAESFHTDVQNARQRFEASAGQLSNEIGLMIPICHGAQPLENALAAACQNLTDAANRFQKRVADSSGLFAQAEKTWIEEKQTQDEVVRISDNAGD